MLINCPRCGFSQPQDQYCAQCGVDMPNFKPKEAPLLKRLLQNTGLQIGALVIIAIIAGQTILSKHSPFNFSKKSSRSSGIFKSEKSSYKDGRSSASSEDDEQQIASVGRNTVESAQLSAAHRNANTTSHSGVDPVNQNPSDVERLNHATAGAIDSDNQTHGKVKVIYAEVPIDVINKWITDSSNSGLYQSLSEYSVGQLSDFAKRGDNFVSLKTYEVEFKPQVNNNTNISGIIADETNQLIGFSTVVERTGRLNDGTLVGTLKVSKRGRNEPEVYASEFELPKGAAFFLVGALKVENFQSDRAQLNMPPFQIFKSNDFMTRKTEFVILLETDSK